MVHRHNDEGPGAVPPRRLEAQRTQLDVLAGLHVEVERVEEFVQFLAMDVEQAADSDCAAAVARAEIEDGVGHASHMRGVLSRRYARGMETWERELVAVIWKLPEGQWTTFGDLGELVGAPGLAGRRVGSYLAKNDLSGAPAWRVLYNDGKAVPLAVFKWARGHRYEGWEPRKVLEREEHVVFNGERADASARVRSLRLSMILDEVRGS